ncbi:MAG: alpha/beta fold hydrolase [Metamycoplasmataceae bacterium]|uniref:alpha/beta fold hydrolase n=1 Tax=Mycoplasmopsis lipophila TaxID=2117 RepID=UPI0038736AF9
MLFNYVEINNLKIPIVVEDKKLDTTILFLHGLNSSSDFAKKLEEYPKKYNSVIMNFPGSKYFQNELEPSEITLEFWYECALKVLKEIKSKNIYLVAHSMAGGIAAKLGYDPRIKKIFMIATINPSMTKSPSYSSLKYIVSPESKTTFVWGKIISLGAKMFSKGRNLLQTFSNKSKWVNLLEKYVLNNDYLNLLDKEYQDNANKMFFIIGQKDKLIGTDQFIEYAKSLKIPATIIGSGHSPIKNEPQLISSLLNSLSQAKKRKFWQSFITFDKNKININVDGEDTNEIDNDIINDALNEIS